MSKVATVTTLRGPLRPTLEFVAYHRNVGVAEVIIFFDDPTDPAIEALRGWPGVTTVPMDAAYRAAVGITSTDSLEARQQTNTTRGRVMARELGCTWTVHIDSDELLHAPGGLPGAFDAVPPSRQAVRVPVIEAVPARVDDADPFRTVDTFRVPVAGARRRLAEVLGGGDAFFAGKYLRAHALGKPAIRTDAEVVRFVGQFPAFAATGKRLKKGLPPMAGVRLMHHDASNLAVFIRKWGWRLDGTANAQLMAGSRQAQYEAFAAVAGDDAAVERLYRRLYMLGRRERIVLRALGLLTTVRLDQRLFDPPDPPDGRDGRPT